MILDLTLTHGSNILLAPVAGVIAVLRKFILPGIHHAMALSIVCVGADNHPFHVFTICQ